MTTDFAELKARFIAVRGYWDAGSEALLKLDPAFFAQAVRLAQAPVASGALSVKICALIRAHDTPVGAPDPVNSVVRLLGPKA